MTARRYCFTFNNPQNYVGDLQFPSIVRYAIWQLEEGDDTHTPHFQGYIELSDPVRKSQLIKAFEFGNQMSFFLCMGNQSHNLIYCTKEDTRIAGPWTYGTPIKQGQRTDLEGMARAAASGTKKRDLFDANPATYVRYHKAFEHIRDLFVEHRETMPDIIWIYGKSGVGKSTKASQMVGDDVYYHNGTKWWDGYEYNESIIWNDYRSGGYYDAALMLQLCDMTPFVVETKHGTMKMVSKKMIFTSNHHPQVYFGHEYENFQRRIKDLIHLSAPEPRVIDRVS